MTATADDLSLSPDVVDSQLAEAAESARPPAEPWLARRLLSIGGSEIAAALVLSGVRNPALPSYLADKVKLARVSVGGSWRHVPRLVGEKAGLLSPGKVGGPADIGTARELELFTDWHRRIQHGAYYCDAEALLDPATAMHASAVPREWMPLRTVGDLSCTPDGWARDIDGALCDVQIKCSYNERREITDYWRWQVIAECEVMRAEWGLLVCGEGWARSMDAPGAIRAWPVEPTAADRAACVEAAAVVMEQVRALRAEVE